MLSVFCLASVSGRLLAATSAAGSKSLLFSMTHSFMPEINRINKSHTKKKTQDLVFLFAGCIICTERAAAEFLGEAFQLFDLAIQ